MALALFIGTDVALLSAFFAATGAVGLVVGRALKAMRDASEARRSRKVLKAGSDAQDVKTDDLSSALKRLATS